MEGSEYPIDRFDPLLRDLVTWNLVVRDGAAGRSRWRLAEAAQRRLDELATSADPVPVDQLVFLDHRCTDCRLRQRTRLYDGVYLCDSCRDQRRARAGGTATDPASLDGRLTGTVPGIAAGGTGTGSGTGEAASSGSMAATGAAFPGAPTSARGDGASGTGWRGPWWRRRHGTQATPLAG